MSGIVRTLCAFAIRIESDFEAVLAVVLKAYEAEYVTVEDRGLSQFAYPFLAAVTERHCAGVDANRLERWLSDEGAEAASVVSVTMHYGQLQLRTSCLRGDVRGEVMIQMGDAGDHPSCLVITGIQKGVKCVLLVRVRYHFNHTECGRHLRCLLEDWGGTDPFKLKRGRRKQELLPPANILKIERPLTIMTRTGEMAG